MYITYICICIWATLNYSCDKYYEQLSQDSIQVCGADMYVIVHLMFVSSTWI